MKNYDLVIAGDKKSPQRYNLPSTYLDVSSQQKKYGQLADTLPYNHYCRKNIGYLYALEMGYELIADSDDDNIPYSDWGRLPAGKNFETVIGPKYPNVYKAFTSQPVWPRGFPIDQITNPQRLTTKIKAANVLVWQGLADGNPDVDALYRLTGGKEFIFKKRPPLVLSSGVISPFNSQNTLWSRPAFVYLYLPHTVTFRYTDILRSFVAQFGIWKINGQLGFTQASARQKRNEHNLLKDFSDEVPMYLTFYQVINILEQCKLTGTPDDLLVMYRALYKNGIVKRAELSTVRVWLENFI